MNDWLQVMGIFIQSNYRTRCPRHPPSLCSLVTSSIMMLFCSRCILASCLSCYVKARFAIDCQIGRVKKNLQGFYIDLMAMCAYVSDIQWLFTVYCHPRPFLKGQCKKTACQATFHSDLYMWGFRVILKMYCRGMGRTSQVGKNRFILVTCDNIALPYIVRV